MSLSLNMTAGEDNGIIWVFKITLDSTTLKLATKDITLSSNDWDGQIIGYDSISEIGSDVNVDGGGGLGTVGNFSFQLARYSANTNLDAFFNDLFPATSKPYITSRKIEVGIIWDTATAETDITYLYEFYIEDYAYNESNIELFCVDENAFLIRKLPIYKAQKTLNNGISYFPNLPLTSEDKYIPIVYGNMTYTGTNINADWRYRLANDYRLAPMFTVDEATYKYSVSCHKVNFISSDYTTSSETLSQYSGEEHFFKSVQNLETYINISRASGTASSNTEAGHTITMLDSGSASIRGDLSIPLVSGSDYNTASNLNNIVNMDDLTDYEELPPSSNNLLALRPINSASTDEVGKLSRTNTTDVRIWWFCGGDGTNQVDYEIYYRNNSLATPASSSKTSTNRTNTASVGTGVGIAQYTTGRERDSNGDTPSIWTMEELNELEFVIENVDAAHTGRVYYGYIDLRNILILNFKRTFEDRRRPPRLQ